jgi:hypothetical protein
MHAAKSTHLPLSVVLQVNRKPAANRGSLSRQRLLHALRLPLFVVLIAIGLARLGVTDSPSAPVTRNADTTVEQQSPVAGAVDAQPAADDADDADSETPPSKEVAELYKGILDLRAQEMAQRPSGQ